MESRDEFPDAFPSGILPLHEPPEAIVDIVFVHGLSGDRERTWASPGKSECWPRDRLPTEVPKARILTYGYDAYVMRLGQVSQNAIRDHARDLVNRLASARTTEEERRRPIIFVVHSLGGIVCKDALQVSMCCAEPHLQAIAAFTRAILFAATPHQGSNMASWAKIPASTLRVFKLTTGKLLAVLDTTSEVRARIHDDFLSSLRKRQSQGPPLDITCLFESLKTGPVTVVPPKSAVIAGYNSLSIHADHRDIVRMTESTWDGPDAIVKELKRWIEEFAMEYGEIAGIDPRRVRRCVQSLTFSQLYDRQSAIERASDDTCAWIFDHRLYRAWIKGKPGSGKSTLMKFLLEKSSPLSGSLRLLFFFNARGTELERSLLGLYRSFMLHLVKEKRSRPAMKAFLTTFDEKEEALGEGKSTWQLTELQDAFGDALASKQLPPLELFVDALDECEEGQVRRFVRFIDVAVAKALSKGIVLNVCWSSRYYPHISIKNSFELYVEEQNNADIQKYVHAELTACGSLDEDFQFGEEIVEKSRGVFLWATLVVQKLVQAADQGLPTTHMLNLLKSLPTELDELLQEIFQSIDPVFCSDTLHLIQWTLFAKRPLYLEELPVALRFSMQGSAPSSLEDFMSSLEWGELLQASPNDDLVTTTNVSRAKSHARRLWRYVTTISGGLIEVAESNDGQQYLQVIHESVRDFLLQPHVHARFYPQTQTDFNISSSKTLLEACGTFILSPEFRYCLPPACESVLKTDPAILARGQRWIGHPFMRYALENLTIHAADAGMLGQDLNPEIRWLWIQLYRRWLAIFCASTSDDTLVTCRERFDGLLIKAGILADDLEAGQELYCAKNLHWVYLDLKNDQTNQAAVAWQYASFQDFEPSLDQLKANKPACDSYQGIFHHYALHSQDRTQPSFNLLEIQCFFQLLEHAQELRWQSERLPVLFWAVELDKPDIIRDLIRCCFDCNEVDDSLRTPLCFAIELEHLQSVLMLLSMGADIRRISEGRKMPLLVAAELGRDDILTLLLEKGANPNCFNSITEEYALAAATRAGHYSTIEILLRHGAAVDAWDRKGLTALFQAATRKDRRATLQLLLAGASVICNPEMDQFLNSFEALELNEATAFVKEVHGTGRTGAAG